MKCKFKVLFLHFLERFSYVHYNPLFPSSFKYSFFSSISVFPQQDYFVWIYVFSLHVSKSVLIIKKIHKIRTNAPNFLAFSKSTFIFIQSLQNIHQHNFLWIIRNFRKSSQTYLQRIV